MLANDRDVDNGDTLRVVAVAGRSDGVTTAVAGSQGGRFTLAADGSYVFDPGDDFASLAAGQTATTRVNYTVSDSQGATADRSMTHLESHRAMTVDARTTYVAISRARQLLPPASTPRK